MADPKSETTPTRDEARIALNLADYHEAAQAYRVLTFRAQSYKVAMDRALRFLRDAGGHAEAERLANAE